MLLYIPNIPTNANTSQLKVAPLILPGVLLSLRINRVKVSTFFAGVSIQAPANIRYA